MLTTYAAHTVYVAPARSTAELPRLVLGVIAIELIYATLLHLTDNMLAQFPPRWSDGYYYGDTQLGLLAQLFSYGLLGGAVLLVVRLFHQRGLFSLLGPGPFWRPLRQVTLAVLALFLLTDLLPPYWSSEGMYLNRPLGWLALLPLSLVALLVQIGSEELFYRGYVQQQLAARFKSPLVWMIGPNLLFAYAHFDGAAPLAESAQYVTWAFVFGLAASDLTARTGRIGAAMGFHLANNIYAFLLFGDEGASDSGLALFLWDTPAGLVPPDPTPVSFLSGAFGIELVFVLVMWLAARLVLRR